MVILSQEEDKPDLGFIKPATKKALTGSEASCFVATFIDNGQRVSPDKLVRRRVEGCDVVTVDDFLSEQECTRLRLCIDENPALSFWSEAGRENDKARAFRDAETIEVESMDIAKTLWQRRRMSSAVLAEGSRPF